jgi:hypothetical protein
MLAQGIMDAVTALSLLDMRHRVSAGDKGTINLLRETESEQT